MYVIDISFLLDLAAVVWQRFHTCAEMELYVDSAKSENKLYIFVLVTD